MLLLLWSGIDMESVSDLFKNNLQYHININYYKMYKLLRYNNEPVTFDISKIVSITANGNLVYVKMTDYITHTGYCIVPIK